jgi:uncharacterized membrane protein
VNSARKGLRFWLATALALSLAVNLALIGFVAGHLLAPGAPFLRPDPGLWLLQTLRELPDARREALRPLVQGERGQLRRGLRDIRAAQRTVNDALRAEPFSPEALADALARFRTTVDRGQAEGHARLVRLAAALTPAERAALAERLQQRGPPRRPPSPPPLPGTP